MAVKKLYGSSYICLLNYFKEIDLKTLRFYYI